MLLYYNYDKNLKSIKQTLCFCFSMWIMIHFSIANVPKVKKWPTIMKFEFSRVNAGWLHTLLSMARARENSKWYKFKKPRFGTFQSTKWSFFMWNYLLENKNNIYLWKKTPLHRPSKTTSFAKLSSNTKKKKKRVTFESKNKKNNK